MARIITGLVRLGKRGAQEGRSGGRYSEKSSCRSVHIFPGTSPLVAGK